MIVLALVFIPMLIEARRAARNERAQRARGGIEPPATCTGSCGWRIPAAFLAMIVEGAIGARRRPP